MIAAFVKLFVPCGYFKSNKMTTTLLYFNKEIFIQEQITVSHCTRLLCHYYSYPEYETVNGRPISTLIVNLRRAWLVLRWATVCGFNSRCQTRISVCNQPAGPKANSAFHPSRVGKLTKDIGMRRYTVWVKKSSPPKTFCDIFSSGEPVNYLGYCPNIFLCLH